MAGEYVKCESELKMALCMSADCMCRNFCDKITSLTEPKKIDCAVYAFAQDGLSKYGFGAQKRNMNEEEAGQLRLI